ncbi:MAG: xanthine dehydrogenase family protein subunit M [Planctomycetes bacterium]|nr:xanthine dehydrogenase family protein subunit M [Planctomycetota bacterium]
MKAFQHVVPNSLQEVVTLLNENPIQSKILAGGLDLLGEMKEHIVAPDMLISISHLDGLNGIRTENGITHIGAVVTLTELAENSEMNNDHTVLAQAAQSVGSPQIRNRGTLGGNLCQRPRCWYYRDEHYSCLKKGGDICFSVAGQNRYHAILGGGPCFMVHPSDCAPALIALGARAHLQGSNGSRVLPMEDFYHLPGDDVFTETTIQSNEIVTEVEIPAHTMKSIYLKVREKESFDWALATVAAVFEMDGPYCLKANLVIGGVAPIPWRAAPVEQLLQGRELTDSLAAEAAEVAVMNALPLSGNEPKMIIAKALVTQAIQSFKSDMTGSFIKKFN